MLLFSGNKIFEEWNNFSENFHLIEYILPTEDLEDLKLIKSKYEFIEEYDFKEIITKYDLEDSIIALIFKNENQVRVLTKIDIADNLILKNQSFNNTNINRIKQVEGIINSLKIVYEDYRGDKYFAVDCERTEFTNSIKCKNKYLNEQELKDASEQALKETEDMNKNNALIMKCADKALKDFTTSFCANRLEDKLQIPAYAKAYEKGTRIRDLSLYDDGEEFDYIWTVEYKQHHKCIKDK